MMRSRQVKLRNAFVVNIFKFIDEERVFILIILLAAIVSN